MRRVWLVRTSLGASAVALLSGGAALVAVTNATALTAAPMPGTVTCTGVSGGVLFAPSLSQNLVGGEVALFSGELMGCTSTDSGSQLASMAPVTGKITILGVSATTFTATFDVLWQGTTNNGANSISKSIIRASGTYPVLDPNTDTPTDNASLPPGSFTNNVGFQFGGQVQTVNAIHGLPAGTYDFVLPSHAPGGGQGFNGAITVNSRTLSSVQPSVKTLLSGNENLVGDPITDTGGGLPLGERISGYNPTSDSLTLSAPAVGTDGLDTFEAGLPLSVPNVPKGFPTTQPSSANVTDSATGDRLEVWRDAKALSSNPAIWIQGTTTSNTPENTGLVQYQGTPNGVSVSGSAPGNDGGASTLVSLFSAYSENLLAAAIFGYVGPGASSALNPTYSGIRDPNGMNYLQIVDTCDQSGVTANSQLCPSAGIFIG